LERDLKDDKNESTCVLVVYQATPNFVRESNKKMLLNSLVSHWLEEPFFDDLRTKQQLGYVVAARGDNKRQVPNIWFLV